MSSPFDGIITPGFKLLHKQMIEALLDCDSCSIDCVATLEGTKFTDCPNCLKDNLGGKSANVYAGGGPIPFTHGMCPYCLGAGELTTQATETVCLMPIWDSKRWILSNPNIKVADIAVQTMSKINTYPVLQRTSKLTIDTSLTPLGIPDFIRLSNPEPLGFGGSNFIICSWGRA